MHSCHSEGMDDQWSEGSWSDALPTHSLFRSLQEDGEDDSKKTTGKALLCESRGDLFVWSPAKRCLLTTNLKRLHARREEADIFQRLYPLLLPVHQPTSLQSSPASHHIAIVGDQYVSVLELRRQRGPYGEFAGGVAETECLTTAIASTILRAHGLTVQHVSWHPQDHETMLLLTSEGALRLFSITQPEVPLLSVSVLAIAVPPHTLRLEEEGGVAGCSVVQNKAVLLFERVDVVTVSLQTGAEPSAPLAIHPVTEDNYTAGGCGMLVLDSYPPVLAIATDSGKVLHGVLISEEEDLADSGLLCVVETVSLPLNNITENRLQLIKDSQSRTGYCILCAGGLYQVTLPWLTALKGPIDESLPFIASPASAVEHLISCSQDSVMDAVLVSDPMLGSTAVLVFDDYSCNAVPLITEPKMLDYIPAIGTPAKPPKAISTSECLYRHIKGILHPTDISSPVKRSGKEVLLQEECFKFIQQSSTALRNRYVTPQTKAKVELAGRIELLAQRKNRQVNDYLSLEQQAIELREVGELQATRVDEAKMICSSLMRRVAKILCEASTCSPLLSEAEENMGKELRELEHQLLPLRQLTSKAQAKVEYALNNSGSGQPKISAANQAMILNAMEEDGRNIKQAMEAVNKMTNALNTAVQ